MMLEFIQTELIESRLFRSPQGVDGRSARDLARVAYLILLSVEMIRQTDEVTAQSYAGLTIQFGDFDSMRPGATDLANLLSVLSNQHKYEDKLRTDYDISAPVLQIKTYLRSVWQSNWWHGRDRQTFINIENMLDISDAMLSQIRRIVLDWNLSSRSEQRNAMSNIRRELARHALRVDIIDYLPK
jgi:hypothetical protein